MRCVRELAFAPTRFEQKVIMNRFEFPVLLTAAREGGFVVTCRDVPPLVTQGEDQADTLLQAADAMDEMLATYMVEGIDFLELSKSRRREQLIAPSAETMAKATLYLAMREAGIGQI